MEATPFFMDSAVDKHGKKLYKKTIHNCKTLPTNLLLQEK